MVKVVIFGGREFTDYDMFVDNVVKILDSLEISPDDVEVVEGGARGADRLAKNFADNLGLKTKRFEALWDKQGKAAGYIRNEKMAKYCDFGIGFHDGESKGTGHMIDLLRKHDKDVYIVNY